MAGGLEIKMAFTPEINTQAVKTAFAKLKESIGIGSGGVKIPVTIDTDKITSEAARAGKAISGIKPDSPLEEPIKKVGAATDELIKKTGQYRDARGRLHNADGSFAKDTQDVTQFGNALSGTAGKMLAFTQTVQAVTIVSDSISQLTQAGRDYESSLQAVGAITGFTGDALEGIGQKARDLSIAFGGSATNQLKSFQGILSKLGPQMAEDSAALEMFARNVNILSAASGDDAATSMNAITDAMLQMGLATGTPMEQAQKSTAVINALAASAQVGAAEIPQVAEALVVAGVAAKGANMDIVGVNAAIQVLAVGGKTGSEAGTALRNVLGLLQKASGPAAATMVKLGTSVQELGQLLTTQGLDAAMGKLAAGMKNLSTDAERNAALMEIFGTENSAAAGILMQNLDKFSEFSEGIKAGMEGSGSAFEQAAMRMNTSESIIARAKAVVEDFFVGMTQTFGQTFTAIAGATSQIAPMATTFFMMGQMLPIAQMKSFALTILSKVVPSLVVSDVATKSLVINTEALRLSNVKNLAVSTATSVATGIKSAAMFGLSIATKAVTIAQWLWNAAMMANPIGLIVGGLAIAGAAILAFSALLSKSAKDREANVKAEGKLLDKQIADNQNQQNKIKTQQNLINSYEELGKKTQRTAEEEDKFRNIQLELARQFPGLISGSRSFAENLAVLRQESNKGGQEITKLQTEMRQLQSKKIELKVDIKKAEADTTIENMGEMLTEYVDDDDWAMVNLKGYTNAMKKAANEADLSEISKKLQLSIYGSKDFADVPPEMKVKLLEQVKALEKQLGGALQANRDNAQNMVQLAVDDMLKGKGTVSKATLNSIAEQTKLPIKEIEKMYDEAKSKALNSKMDEAIKNSFKIKGEIGDLQGVQTLVKEYESALKRIQELKDKKDSGGKLTAAEQKEFDELALKADQAKEKIALVAPAAIAGMGTATTEAGKIKTVYDLNIAKAKEFIDAQMKTLSPGGAQNDYEKALIEQADLLDKQMGKLDDLRVQIQKTTDPEEKKKLIELYNKELDSIDKNKESLVDYLKQGMQSGIATQATIEKIADALGITSNEARKLALGDAFGEALKNGTLTVDQIEKMAAMFGVSKEEAVKMYNEQKKQTDEAKKTEEAVLSIGQAYAKNIKTMREEMDKQRDEYLALQDKIKKGTATDSEKATFNQLKKQLGDLASELRKADKANKDFNDKFKTTWEEKKSTVKDISDKLLQIERENNELKEKMSIGAVKSEEDRARQEKEINLKKSEDKIQGEIDTLTKKMDLNAQELKQLELLNEQLRLTREYNDSEMLKFEEEQSKKRIEAERKTDEKILKNRAESMKLQLELLEKGEMSVSSNGDLVYNLEQQHKIRMDLIRMQGDDQINQVLQNNDDYQEAQEQLLAVQAKVLVKEQQLAQMIASNASQGIVDATSQALAGLKTELSEAEKDINVVADRIKGTDYVANIRVKINNELQDEDLAYSDDMKNARIADIKDLAEQEREIKLAEAKTTLDKELAESQGNNFKQLEAWKKYLAAKEAADKEYYKKSKDITDNIHGALMFLSEDFATSMMEGTSAVDDAITKLQGKYDEMMNPDNSKALEDIKKEEDEFKASLNNRKMSSAEFFKAINEFEKRKTEASKKEASKQEAFWTKTALSVAKSMAALSKNMNDQAMASAGNAKTIIAGNMQKLESEGKLATASVSEIMAGSSEELATFAQNAVGSSVAAFGAMLAAGEDFGTAFRKGLLKNLLEMAEKAILTFIPEIYAVFMAEMGWPGFFAATAAIGLIYSALSVAKSVIGSYTGEVDIQGPGTETSDDIPRRVSRRESILTAQATKADGNKDLFKWLNRTGKPAIDYFITEKPELMKTLTAQFLAEELAQRDAQQKALQDQFLRNTEWLKSQKENALRALESEREINKGNIKAMERQYRALQEEVIALRCDIVDLKETLSNTIKDTARRTKTQNQIDVDIHVDDNNLVKRVNVEKESALRRL